MRIAHVCYRFGGSCAFCTSFDVESEIYEGDSFPLFGWLTVCIHSLYYSAFVSVIESAIERLNSVEPWVPRRCTAYSGSVGSGPVQGLARMLRGTGW
jgi:hypothetical protein